MLRGLTGPIQALVCDWRFVGQNPNKEKKTYEESS
jgi:hypothetical protein